MNDLKAEWKRSVGAHMSICGDNITNNFKQRERIRIYIGFQLAQGRESNDKGFCRRQLDFRFLSRRRISIPAERISDTEEMYAMELLI
jgi:hypothetical protein